MNPLNEETRAKLWAQYEKHLNEIRAASNALDDRQIFEAFCQALAAGDFLKSVVRGTNAQNIVYIPYRGMEELRGRLDAVTALAKEAAEALREVRTGEDFEVECHSIASKIDEHFGNKDN